MSLSNDFVSSLGFKLILLICLVLQNSTTVLVGRYTRTSVTPDELYVVNHMIVVSEIGKLLLSCVLEHLTSGGQLVKSLKTNIIEKPYDALKIMIPALLYLLQNSLQYFALSNLTAPIFQVTYQGKLVTTAIVSVIMLNRKYTFQQWVCLVVLSGGVAIVVLGESGNETKAVPAGEQSLLLGLLSVTVSCISSALAGVYFEKVVKTPSNETNGEKSKPVSVWMRNIQLAFFTILTALFQGAWSQKPGESDVAKSYLHGFTAWVWVLVLLQAGGGLLVAAVIKYADNVLKGLATGVSVCFATAVSTVVFGTRLGAQFSVGAAMILGAVFVFSNPVKISSKNPTASGIDDKDMQPMLPK